MLAKVLSGAVYGVDAYTVEIEVNAGHGDPAVVIVGLPDAAVKESKDRVHTAIVNSGYKPHVGRTTVNLAPADTRKEGPIFDLPIAVGMLAAQGEVAQERVAGMAFVGELALSGEVRRVRGALPIVIDSPSPFPSISFMTAQGRKWPFPPLRGFGVDPPDRT